ncbi:MAG TPA: hypothetical protein VGB96_19590, partial [Archangium sp.]
RGAIVLSRESRSRTRDEKRTIADLATGTLPSSESYDALVARLVDESRSGAGAQELGEYKLSHHGYPVSLVYADVDEYCHDKPSLEQALVELLGHPVTGGKLRRLMDLHARQKSLAGGTPPQTNGGQNGKAE